MPRDMSLTAVATLHTLERHGPQRLTRVASLEGVTQPSMTALVTRLERDGFVERRPDHSDRRVVLVALTGAGEAYVRHRRQLGVDRLAGLMGELPGEQAVALRAALAAIAGLCHLDQDAAAIDDAAPAPLPEASCR